MSVKSKIRQELEHLKELKLIHIENREQYLVKQPHFHPSTRSYKEFKIGEVEKCIYGMWGEQSDGYRWLPPCTYFYANYVKIKMEDHLRQEVTKLAQLDDLEWMFGYLFISAYGFSGFEYDDEYSCDEALINSYEMTIAVTSPERFKHLRKANGDFKEYRPAYEYLCEVKPKKLGDPLYFNEASNVLVLGSRGSGKSYSLVGISEWLITFDGAKEFNDDFKNMKLSANVIMGSDSDKTTIEFCTRLEDANNHLLTDADLGVYTAPGIDPMPLLGRHMLGKATKYWTYKFEQGGVLSGGTGSSFKPISYSSNKKGGGATSAASARCHLSIVDEVGKLGTSAIKVWGSNRALVRRNTQFGVQWFAGTSGNMELVQPAKKMFENTKDYRIIGFPNVYTNPSETIGFFIPAFLIKRDFKDKDGNTKVAEAVEYFIQQLENCATNEALNEQKMNYPLIPEHMWITKNTSIFPKDDIKKRYKELLELKSSGREEEFRRFVEMTWKKDKVEWHYIDPKYAKTIDSFHDSQGSNKAKNKKGDTDTHVIIYEEPQYQKDDFYVYIGLDPYVAEEKDEGESLGSMWILKNPKYISEGYTGDIIVAEYTGKTVNRAKFYENVEKLLAMYGNPRRALMYEAVRGADYIDEYFKKNNKEYILAYRPKKYQDGNVMTSRVVKYGYLLGQNEDKDEMLTALAEWLMTSTTLEKDGTKKNLERISSLGLLSELLEYDRELDKQKKANYDRISGFIGCLVARRERFNQFKERTVEEKESIGNVFAKYTPNYIVHR